MEMRTTYSNIWFKKLLIGFKFSLWNCLKPISLSLGANVNTDKAVIIYEESMKKGVLTTFSLNLMFMELRLGLTWLQRDLTEEERWEYTVTSLL